MDRNKRILLIVLLVVILSLPFFVYVSKRVIPGNIENKQVKSSISQVVNFESIKPSIKISTNIKQDETALELLKKTSQVVTKGEGSSAYVVGINGVIADDTKKEYWAFYINSQLSPVGAGGYKLIGGEQIEWKLEKY